jgi:hypothetical protein
MIDEAREIERRALDAYDQSLVTLRRAQRESRRLHHEYLAAVEARKAAEKGAAT